MHPFVPLLVVLALFAAPALAQTPPPVGINAGFHVPWGTQTVFVDAMRQAGDWQAYPADDADVWDSGAAVPVDPAGLHPTPVPFPAPWGDPQHVRTRVLAGDGVESGRYTLTFGGQATVRVAWDSGAVEYSAHGPTESRFVDIPATDYVDVEITRSLAADPLRDLRLLRPGFTAADGPYHPDFVGAVAAFGVLRAMDLQQLNGGVYPCDGPHDQTDVACEVGVGTMVEPHDPIQGGARGLAVEHIADIADAAGVDLWVTVPHAATVPYMQALAARLAARLDAGRRVHVELSNEIWNDDPDEFPQSVYFVALGAGLDPDPEEARRQAYVQKAALLYDAFAAVFGDDSPRVVRVVGGSLEDIHHNDRLLALFADAVTAGQALPPHALALGAYFGVMTGEELLDAREAELAALVAAGDPADPPGPGDLPPLSTATVLQAVRDALVLDREDPLAQGEASWSVRTLVRRNRDLATTHGVALVAYEGGQHLVMRETGPLADEIRARMHDAQTDPEMAALYHDLLTLWVAFGGGLFNAYHLVGAPGDDAFGVLTHTGQSPAAAPKFATLRDIASGVMPLDDTCDADHPWLCDDSAGCDAIGGIWCAEFCTQDAACPGFMCTHETVELCADAPGCAQFGGAWCGDRCDPDGICCTASAPWGCATADECAGAGLLWCDDFCHDEPTCPDCQNNPWDCWTEAQCLDAGHAWCGTWCDGHCP